MGQSFRSIALFSTAVGTLLACTDPPSRLGPAGPQRDESGERNREKVLVCHASEAGAREVEVGAAAWPGHARHGDYVARMVVDRTHPAVGDGVHFARIGDAIASARAARVAHDERESAACRITILVASGVFAGSTSASADPSFERFPIVIDVPDLTLRGAFEMVLDADGRATGTSATGESSTFLPTPGLTAGPGTGSPPILMVNGDPGGFQGHGIVVEGFVFQSGHTGADTRTDGQGILSLRVRDLVVRGNRFDGGFTESVDLRATSARVESNHLSGRGGSCDVCLAGPGDYSAVGNRLIGPGGIPGILVTAATLLPVPTGIEQYVLPRASLVSAWVHNNEVRNHLARPVGAGVRVGVIGVGAPNVASSAKVRVSDNSLIGNSFGVIAEAAFPVANTLLRGDIELTLSGNVIERTCQNDMLVTMSRHVTGLGLPGPLPAFLRNSSYSIWLGGNVDWARVWYFHPANQGNTLMVDGVVVPEGVRRAYDASRVCAPT